MCLLLLKLGPAALLDWTRYIPVFCVKDFQNCLEYCIGLVIYKHKFHWHLLGRWAVCFVVHCRSYRYCIYEFVLGLCRRSWVTLVHAFSTVGVWVGSWLKNCKICTFGLVAAISMAAFLIQKRTFSACSAVTVFPELHKNIENRDAGQRLFGRPRSCLDIQFPNISWFGYPVSIFYDFQTNICTWNISGFLSTSQDISRISYHNT